MLAAPQETCVFPLAALCLLSENSHQGHRLPTAALHQGFAPVNSCTATGFGTSLYDEGERSRSTGKERDAETGLDFFGPRYFSGVQGRFTSPDGPFNDQDAADPQSWNMYSYGRNNPLRFTDPTGMTVCDENGNNCHDDVTVNGGDTDPVDYVWSFLQSAGSQAMQNAVNATDTALTVINNFRNSSNCTGAVTAAGAAAGAGIGAQAGSDIGAAAGAGLGTFALPGGGTIGGGVIGFGVGGGILVVPLATGAVAHLAASQRASSVAAEFGRERRWKRWGLSPKDEGRECQ